MGSLQAFDIPAIKSRYGLTHFVETGTGRAESLIHAHNCQFDHCYSIEIDKTTLEKAEEITRGLSDITIVHAPSRSGLPEVLKMVSNVKRVLFWLDAHFPGHNETDFLDTEHADAIPLQQELEILRSRRDISRDVILMDDLRIYEDGPFAHGAYRQIAESLHTTNASFVDQNLSLTHKVFRSYAHEGYLVALPLYTPSGAGEIYTQEDGRISVRLPS